MTDCATKRLWLAEAELALHRLLTGQQAVEIDFGPSKGVKYTQANVDDLRAYVSQLRREVAECDGTAATTPRRGPVRFVF